VGITRTDDATFPGQLYTADLSERTATSILLEEVSSANPVDAVVNNVGLVRPQSPGRRYPGRARRSARPQLAYCDPSDPGGLTRDAPATLGPRGQHRGLVALGAPKQRTAYAAAKAALIGATRVWALELAATGITVNCSAKTTHPAVRAKAVTAPWFPWAASDAPRTSPRRSPFCCRREHRLSPDRPSSSTAARLSDGS